MRFFAYDSTGRLAVYADSLSADSLVCTLDPHGQDGEHCTPSGGWSFVSQASYTSDSANNRTDLGGVLTPGNRATSFNGYTLTYDNAGNLTHKSKTGFDQYYYWNSIGQLDSVVANGSAVHFGYDGQGRRVRKATTAHTLRYIYSGSHLVAEVDTGSLTAQKIYRYYPGVDRPMSVKQPAGTYYYLSGIGTPGVTGLIDSTGVIRNRYRYSPWGTLEDSLEGVPNVLKFAAREYDPETNLYYNRARYYDPQLARFLSEDPVGQSGGVNQYAYAGNNPIGAADPSGEACDYWDPGGGSDGGTMNDWGYCSPMTDGIYYPSGPRPGCSDRGPVSINGGTPDMGFSSCEGHMFDDGTGQDMTAEADQLAEAEDLGATLSALRTAGLPPVL